MEQHLNLARKLNVAVIAVGAITALQPTIACAWLPHTTAVRPHIFTTATAAAERRLTSGAEPKVGFPTERTNVVLTNALGITEGIYEHLRGAYDVVYAQSITLSELPLDHHVLALRYMYSGFRVVFEVRSYSPVDGRSQRYSW
mgnify:CR=1 FL=1